MLQLANAQIIPILYGGDKMFLRNFFDIPKSHEKTASHSIDIKNICPESKGCARSPLPPYMDEGNGQVRNRASYNTFETLTWVGIFGVGIFRGEFTRGSLMGGNFPGENFPWGNFPRTIFKWGDILHLLQISLEIKM